MFIERRFGKRETVKLSGRITSPDGAVTEVLVTDYTSMGCRLVACGSIRIPKHFSLRVQGGALPPVKAEMVWRRGDEIGVKFLLEAERSTFQPATGSTDWPGITYGR